jgi:hypothetical protein
MLACPAVQPPQKTLPGQGKKPGTLTAGVPGFCCLEARNSKVPPANRFIAVCGWPPPGRWAVALGHELERVFALDKAVWLGCLRSLENWR